mmetsp:Transcript_22989/g.38800  ORF Transcript_22989/g.38800 Transcript_22989/m.38800 type:complete len:488 (+) Transcript_22989:73-1536(+)
MGTITFDLNDKTGLTATEGVVYVAGWINGGSYDATSHTTDFKILGSDGTFAATTGSTLPYYKLSDVDTVTLTDTTNGNDRLVFLVSTTQPAALDLLYQTWDSVDPKTQKKVVNKVYDDVQMYTQYPYLNAPGVAAEGPYDFIEFGMNAAFDVSAVDGMCLNLNFTVSGNGNNPDESFGVDSSVTRADIATAYTAFLANQTGITGADAYSVLLYDAPILGSTYTPPLIDGQFFALTGPNDYLAATTSNYGASSGSPLESYWTTTLQQFFTQGALLSINLSGDPTAPNIYSGQCMPQTNPTTGTTMLAYSLSNGTNTYQYFTPLGADPVSAPNELQGAQYVFQQAFTDQLTPGVTAPEAMLLQDTIWEALCRGVALEGVGEMALDATDTPTAPNAFSTTAWNDQSKWYSDTAISQLYAKFMHTSDVNGGDYRTLGTTPIMLGGSAYGFSMDETPIGPYTGTQVPSKTLANVSEGTVTVNVGAWSAPAPK